MINGNGIMKFCFNIILIGLFFINPAQLLGADSLDTKPLEKLIISANALYINNSEGLEEGQFEAGSKAILLSTINEAEEFVNNPGYIQQQVDSVLWYLADVCVTFESNVTAAGLDLIDDKATRETIYLYSNLNKLSYDYLIFGMHDATGYGVGWENNDDRSDVKDVCGSYPGVYSEDMNHILQNEEVTRQRYRMINAYNRGGILTMSWHQFDPLGRSFYASRVNNERIVETLLPGGQYHEFYKEKLYRVAIFFKTLRGQNGGSIPVIFRPYHEHTGSWFWWGEDHCTTQEYIDIWRFTVGYLRDTLNVHNLIYALSPSAQQISSSADYFNIYPGDDYVDIFGVDKYFGNPISDVDKTLFSEKIQYVVQASDERKKVVALTEVGQENLPTTNFFSDVLLDPIKKDSITSKIIFAAVWRNLYTGHHFAPYPGHPSVPDFINFYKDPYTLFQNNLPDMYKPVKPDTTAPQIIEYPEPDFISYYKNVLIEVTTNERAYLKYSLNNEDYGIMPNIFSKGHATRYHTTIIPAAQGDQGNIYVRGMDFYGNVMDSSISVSYIVDTLQRPVSWIEPSYSTDNWKRGNAPFSFLGESGDETKIPNSRTVFFRSEFNVEDVDSINQLVLFLKYDNGAILYLNGKEIRRASMPNGEIEYGTWALNSSGSFITYTLGPLDLQYLKNGQNTLGIEIHQSEGDSTDLFFDLYLFSPDILINYGAEWQYYSKGGKPPDKVLGSMRIYEESFMYPIKFRLKQNYPNPFNSVTHIKYTLAKSGQVTISVYNVLGKKIKTLINKYHNTGNYSILFNGAQLASGIYYYRAEIADHIIVRKMILLK